MLDELVLQVEETPTVEQSVVVLLDGIKAQLDTIVAELKANKADTKSLAAFRKELDAKEVVLADAVAAIPGEPQLKMAL